VSSNIYTVEISLMSFLMSLKLPWAFP